MGNDPHSQADAGRVPRSNASRREVLDFLRDAGTPAADGWSWLYAVVNRLAPPQTGRRRLLCSYFRSRRVETGKRSLLYRLLGVPHFGRYIPTGGVGIRRATGARMRPYTLSGASLRGAREFWFRACVFEALHLPFFLTLVVLAAHRFSTGRADFAIQETVMNAVVNLYPMLHHRHTRARIVRLLARAGRPSRSTASPSDVRPPPGGMRRAPP